MYLLDLEVCVRHPQEANFLYVPYVDTTRRNLKQKYMLSLSDVFSVFILWTAFGHGHLSK